VYGHAGFTHPTTERVVIAARGGEEFDAGLLIALTAPRKANQASPDTSTQAASGQPLSGPR